MNFIVFSFLLEQLSLSFIALGTSFDMGKAPDRCSPSNTSVRFSLELFDVFLLGWARQGQTLMRIQYAEDWEGRGW